MLYAQRTCPSSGAERTCPSSIFGRCLTDVTITCLSELDPSAPVLDGQMRQQRRNGSKALTRESHSMSLHAVALSNLRRKNQYVLHLKASGTRHVPHRIWRIEPLHTLECLYLVYGEGLSVWGWGWGWGLGFGFGGLGLGVWDLGFKESEVGP